MPHSRNSEESDQHSLLSQDSVELGLDEKTPNYMTSPSRFRQFISLCNAKRLIISIIIILTIIIVAFTTLTSRSKPSSDIFTKHCGSTADEAISLGCKFDVINFSWQPPECFDEEVYNRYWDKSQEGGPIKWYADSKFTQELPQDLEMLKHKKYVWAEHRFHLMHCMYTWELMHHALMLDRPVVEFMTPFNHTMHCADMVLMENWKVQDTSIIAQFSRCTMLT